jgi:hypothetical protein
MSAFCYTSNNTTIVSGFSVETTKEFRRMNIVEPTVEQCTHCRMFGHLVDQCAMLTGEYPDKYDDDYDEEYVDYYEEYDKLRRTSFSGVSSYSFSYASRILHNYLDSCDNDPISPMELADKDEAEGNENVLTEEEYAQWMREAAEEDEYAEDHSPEADVRWAKQSSMAAFDHFQRTGAQLKNSEFVGKKAGAPLRSELDGMDE